MGLLNQCFRKTLSSIANTLDHVKCMSLNDQQCRTHFTLVNLHFNQYIEGLYYYSFADNLNRCMGSCNTLNDLSYKICVPNKTEDLNLSVFKMITGINESNVNINVSLTVENVTRMKSGIMINVDVSAKIQKNIMYVKKIIFEILAHVFVKILNI